MKINNQTYYITDDGGLSSKFLIVGIVGIVATLAGFFMIDRNQFFHSYLVGFMFWVSIGLCGLFFTMIHHLTGANWSVVLRRISESIMVTLPWMAVFFIPIAVIGMPSLYHWTDAATIANDPLIQKKLPFLNTNFFIIRAALYFIIWFLISRTLYNSSLQQDKAPTEAIAKRMERVSAPGMLLFAVTITFAAFDWLMSLDPDWYSTIFGVYVFAGSWLAALSFMTLVALYLRGKGILADEITVEHYHDLGKFMFAFTVFWAYIGFSQFFLIWYGNIPEETIFYRHRWDGDGSWKMISMLLLVGRFVLPFIMLLPRAAKRNLTWLKVVASWILLMQFVDLFWIVSPNLHAEGVKISWMDFAAVVGIGGIFLWLFWKRFTSRAILPIGDPGLQTSIQFINQ